MNDESSNNMIVHIEMERVRRNVIVIENGPHECCSAVLRAELASLYEPDVVFRAHVSVLDLRISLLVLQLFISLNLKYQSIFF